MLTLTQLLTTGALILTLGLLEPGRAMAAAPVDFTLLHTNDLHSHFKPDLTALGLGGVARLKTAIRKVRSSVTHSLLVDGGDWSEGNIYYNQGAGIESLKMLDHLGYDAAVVGNHDWYNGPDVMLDAIRGANPRVSLLAANVDAREYANKAEFQERILPFVIKEVGGIKVAIIGLVTYEFVFDKFLEPVEIRAPFAIAAKLAHELRKSADAVFVISHNHLEMNRYLLETIPDIDLIIGAHDHEKVVKPIVVNRVGASAGWLVEAGSWGKYLGRVDMRITPRSGDREGKVEFVNYKLQQMDSTVAEDPETSQKVENLERLLEGRYGPIFHDDCGESDVDFSRSGQENTMGNLVTDAYRAATGADFALDQSALIYGQIQRGNLSTADIYNVIPAIHNPATGLSWTLNTLPLKGRTLKWIVNLLFASKKVASLGIMSASGMRLVFDPLLISERSFLSLMNPDGNWDTQDTIIKTLEIGGVPVLDNQYYTLAAGGGIVEAIQFINRKFPGAIPLDKMKDTGVEDWRILKDYVSAKSPLTESSLSVGNRVQTLQPDLGLVDYDVTWTPLGKTSRGMRAQVRATIRNSGITPSSGTSWVRLATNENGLDMTVDPILKDLAPAQEVGVLASGKSRTFSWEVVVPGWRDLYPVTVLVDASLGETNTSNQKVTTWLTEKRPVH